MIDKAIDIAGATLIGVAFSALAFAPESNVRTDCDYWRNAFERGDLLNVINKPLRVAPYHARWWGHEGVFACREVEKLQSESFYGFIALATDHVLENYNAK